MKKRTMRYSVSNVYGVGYWRNSNRRNLFLKVERALDAADRLSRHGGGWIVTDDDGKKWVRNERGDATIA